MVEKYLLGKELKPSGLHGLSRWPCDTWYAYTSGVADWSGVGRVRGLYKHRVGVRRCEVEMHRSYRVLNDIASTCTLHAGVAKVEDSGLVSRVEVMNHLVHLPGWAHK